MLSFGSCTIHLLAWPLRGRDVGAGNIAGLKWVYFKISIIPAVRVPARFLIPHLSAKRIFGFTCEDLSGAFGRVLNTKNGPAVQGIYRGFASRLVHLQEAPVQGVTTCAD